MSRFQQLKEAFRRRLLSVAQQQLLQHFQRTICGFEAEISQKRSLLDLLSDPDRLRTTGLPPDVLQVRKEQQGWSFSLNATNKRREADGARRSEDGAAPGGALCGTRFPHSCSVCGKRFIRQVDLKYHALIHAGLRPFKCRVCKRRFRGRGQLRAHRCGLQMKTAHRERPFSCAVCGKRFCWNYQAKQHTCAGTGDSEDPPPGDKKTPWTGATYRRKRKVMESDGEQRETSGCYGNTGTVGGRRHSDQSGAQTLPDIRSSTRQTEEPLRCSACGNRSTSEPEPAGHPCVCESTQDHQEHQNSPAGKDSFSCSVCNAAFWNRDSLVLHMRGHTRLTRFTCPVCTKDFVWRRHLTKHMEVHQRLRGGAAAQNDDSSDCDTDDSDFWTESRDGSSRRRFSCSECRETFTSRWLLKVHAAAHQEQTPPTGRGEVKEEQEEAQISTFNLLSVKTEEEEKPPSGLNGDPLQPESDDSVDSDFWKDDRKRPSVLN